MAIEVTLSLESYPFFITYNLGQKTSGHLSNFGQKVENLLHMLPSLYEQLVFFFRCLFFAPPFPQTIGSLSTHVFETQTATGREHFACQDSGVSQIFILIFSNRETILSNVNVVV